MRKIVSFVIIACFVLSLCSCTAEGGGSSLPESDIVSGDETTTDTSASDTTTTAPPTKSEPTTTTKSEPTTTTTKNKSTTTTTAPAPVEKYDVYINGVGFDLNTTVTVEVILKTTDTAVTVCPCVKLYKKAGSEWVPYEGLYSIGEFISLQSTSGGPVDTDSDPYLMYGRWDWMSNEVIINGAQAKPETDFSAGRTIRRLTQAFSEAGEYKIELTDGHTPEQNNYKYNDALSLKIYK